MTPTEIAGLVAFDFCGMTLSEADAIQLTEELEKAGRHWWSLDRAPRSQTCHVRWWPREFGDEWTEAVKAAADSILREP